MERARHRKSKSASGIEGTLQIQKQKDPARLSSDSRSYIDGRNRNDMFMPEFGQSPSAWANGTPMKKLLAEEMSKEVGSKRQSPSVIARLMGLEGMPSPRHVHRQQKRYSDISVNLQKKNQLYEGRLNKTKSNDHQEFKDVYEDLEASHAVNLRCSSRWNGSSVLTKHEMALIRQKFNEAKRLSTDEKLQDSKELDDTLEMLDSNKDLLLKYLHEPDSLFVNHLQDLKNDSKISVGSHIAVLKPSYKDPGKYESKAKSWRSEKTTSNKHHSISGESWSSEKTTSSKHHSAYHLKRKDGLLLEPHNRDGTHISHRPSRIQLEEKNEELILPTKIVVLKPNLGKMQNDGTSGLLLNLSHGYQSSFKKIKEFQRVGGSDSVTWTRKDSFHDEEFSKPISKEAREIAREITMRMRKGYHDTDTVDTKSMRLKGYAGDESSYDANESDSDSESEELKLSSGKTYSDNGFCRHTRHSRESSVSREAKRRLSERWIMTHKYQDLEMISKSSTLGEMLSLADREARQLHPNAKISLDRPSNQLAGSNGTAMRNGPIGISSRDGWKDEISRNLSRSRLRPPSMARRSNKKNASHDELAEGDPLMHGDSVPRSRRNVAKGNSRRHGDLSERSKSRSKMPYQHKFAPKIDSSVESNIEIQMEANTKDLTKQQCMVEMAAKDKFCRNPVFDEVMIAEPRSLAQASKTSDLLPTWSPSVLDADQSVVNNQDDSQLQEWKHERPKQGFSSTAAEPDSSESSKEADHPSPVSVLEVSFTEETSSSESFERVSAELHELRMQLKLLKMESGTYSGESSLVPIEEEATTQLSPTVSEGNNAKAAISWETSYNIDMLLESGLEESDFDIFRTRWHDTDCPLDPSLFNQLEKKYTTESRSERRFLFDLLNTTILEIFHDHVDPYPWVMPKLGGLNLRSEGGIRDALDKLICQEFVNGDRMVAETLDKEMHWAGSKGEIDMIGNEIEESLMDDMVIELLLR